MYDLFLTHLLDVRGVLATDQRARGAEQKDVGAAKRLETGGRVAVQDVETELNARAERELHRDGRCKVQLVALGEPPRRNLRR